MAITLQNLLNGEHPANEDDLVLLSDRIWALGSLAEIRAQVSSEVFLIFVGMNVIGAWKGDGGAVLDYIKKRADERG